MSGNRGDAGGGEDAELDQAGGSTVPIPERVNPGDVDMRNDCLQHGKQEVLGMVPTVAAEVRPVEPVAHGLNEVVAVLRWRAPIDRSDNDALGTELTGHNMVC